MNVFCVLWHEFSRMFHNFFTFSETLPSSRGALLPPHGPLRVVAYRSLQETVVVGSISAVSRVRAHLVIEPTVVVAALYSKLFIEPIKRPQKQRNIETTCSHWVTPKKKHGSFQKRIHPMGELKKLTPTPRTTH